MGRVFLCKFSTLKWCLKAYKYYVNATYCHMVAFQRYCIKLVHTWLFRYAAEKE